ncbi:class I SAM-dependent methyltransferase [Leminorella grimontii]|uniref:class I SAM-dependent methyltransferase n=1 Tax=Leminorella grimontii TaxID=82981 RepID=UPI0032206E6E
MTLSKLIHRKIPLTADVGSGKIPWNEPEFSARMLNNHLSQEHDWASRRGELIERHVEWIAQRLAKKARILDLGCGPGLYLQMLARKGYQCSGVDFSPAAIDYAQKRAKEETLAIDYCCEDVRTFSPVGNYDFIMMTFGELNVFSRDDATRLVNGAASWLAPNGQMLIEVHSWEEVRRQGLRPSTWETLSTGLFSEHPHLLLTESAWDEQKAVASTAWWTIDACAETSFFTSHMQAWRNDEYLEMLKSAGLEDIFQLKDTEWPVGQAFDNGLFVLCGRTRK